MVEFVASGILGSIFGGLFRLAPEVLKFLDRKNDREHEHKMYVLQTDLEKVRGEYKLETRYVDHSISQIEAIQEAFKEQTAAATNSYKWVAALSALVRPMVTYILFGLYIAVKVVTMNYAIANGGNWTQVIQASWTVDDFAMLNMILTFWFIGRSIEKRESK